MSERSLLTSMIGFLIFVSGLLLIVWGAAVCLSPFDDMQSLVDLLDDIGISVSPAGAVAIGGVAMMAMGMVAIVIGLIGMGSLNGRKVVWFLVIIVYGLSVVACAYTAVTNLLDDNGFGPAGPFPLIVSVLTVCYLLIPDVRERFGF